MKKIFKRLTKKFKLSATDSKTFTQKWEIKTSILQIISLSLLLIFFLAYLLSWAFRNQNLYPNYNSKTLNRIELDKQSSELLQLEKQLNQQTLYLQQVKKVLNGEIHADTLTKKYPKIEDMDLSKLSTKLSGKEKKLNAKVKESMTTHLLDEQLNTLNFIAPLKGKISQGFNFQNHKATDIVCKEGTPIKAIQNGTVLFAGFTQKDGYMLILLHSNNYVSLYKHCEILFKKEGDFVQLGELIGLSGNLGENTDGPHLHLEIWQNNTAIDPQNIIQF